jgi:hypothetical protein
MAALTNYTTYAAVRACLGVSVKELSDETLALENYVKQFELDMNDVDSGAGQVLAQYEAIKVITAGSRTETQQRYYDVVGLLASYHVGVQCLGTVEMFGPKRISDGRAEVERGPDAWDRIAGALNTSYSTLLRRLKALLLTLVPDAEIAAKPARVFAVGVGLGTDPVTGA